MSASNEHVTELDADNASDDFKVGTAISQDLLNEIAGTDGLFGSVGWTKSLQ